MGRLLLIDGPEELAEICDRITTIDETGLRRLPKHLSAYSHIIFWPTPDSFGWHGKIAQVKDHLAPEPEKPFIADILRSALRDSGSTAPTTGSSSSGARKVLGLDRDTLAFKLAKSLYQYELVQRLYEGVVLMVIVPSDKSLNSSNGELKPLTAASSPKQVSWLIDGVSRDTQQLAADDAEHSDICFEFQNGAMTSLSDEHRVRILARKVLYPDYRSDAWTLSYPRAARNERTTLRSIAGIPPPSAPRTDGPDFWDIEVRVTIPTHVKRDNQPHYTSIGIECGAGGMLILGQPRSEEPLIERIQQIRDDLHKPGIPQTYIYSKELQDADHRGLPERIPLEDHSKGIRFVGYDPMAEMGCVEIYGCGPIHMKKVQFLRLLAFAVARKQYNASITTGECMLEGTGSKKVPNDLPDLKSLFTSAKKAGELIMPTKFRASILTDLLHHKKQGPHPAWNKHKPFNGLIDVHDEYQGTRAYMLMLEPEQIDYSSLALTGKVSLEDLLASSRKQQK